MKIGLFGGTLNPVHIGHLRSAEEVREAVGLDSVWFIPAGTPPHKRREELVPWEHRMAMVRLAVSGNPFFRGVDLEPEKAGCSYTVDTLRELAARALPGQEFFFIMGSDAFLDVRQWKEYSALVDYASIVVMGRHGDRWDSVRDVLVRAFPGHQPDDAAMSYSSPGMGDIILVNVTDIDISSTEIRNRLAAGRSVRYLVPEETEKYMNRNDLYIREKTGGSVSDRGDIEPEYAARRIAREIHDNKGEDITILDVRGISAFADFFIIAHGRSSRHVQGIAGKIKKALSREKIKCRAIEGEDDGKWILMDYEDCVVHIFYEPVREFYDLEGLWHEAPRLEWQADS
jgi:nicotinate-nucleotide adenylyltransferase